MATDIVIPNVGESVTTGVISTWLKADGDFVERDETVLELETDKVTMEITAPAAGSLKQMAAEGDEVEVGAVVGAVDESAEKPAAAAAVSSEPATAESAEPSSPAPKVADAPAPSPEPAPAATPAAAAPHSNGDYRTTPLAERIARENNVDLSRVVGTGAGGKIREQDVLAFLQSAQASVGVLIGATGGGKIPATASGQSGPSRAVSRKKMTPLRQRIASRLVEAQQTAAMLTTFNECDMTAVMALRKRYKEAFAEKHGVGLGFMSFFVKAVVNGLLTSPMVNSSIVEGDDGSPAIEQHNYCDIAIAVSSPRGLVVPVIRNAETLSFAGIESKVKELALRARDGKLELSEMMGGTFTITNGGIFGSLMSTPILNPPQSAILGMHTIKKRAVENPDKPGEVSLRPMMYLAVSYDHRIIDGSEAVTFLVAIKDAIENPERLMLDL
ncbi:MAG: 2-oxoglutarate dehydrogenase complex dihydrolipoyllysine-residue succinyltransferase [Planctomycetota bacterium]|nr:2-oxoglutarate dehydrogenase complex dihydrolipoyllysine-residue succinyltransferase [Planctomycetota bacterium]